MCTFSLSWLQPWQQQIVAVDGLMINQWTLDASSCRKITPHVWNIYCKCVTVIIKVFLIFFNQWALLADSSCWRVRVHHSQPNKKSLGFLKNQLKVNQITIGWRRGLLWFNGSFQDWMMGRSTGISMNFPYLRGTTVVSCRFTQVTGGELLDALDTLGLAI